MHYLCIHGHFYQPPRENPWLESVELQDSAYPFHDWNARITAECYGPNATSRILKPNGKISGIMNNYSRISFNMGPTLLSWLEENEPMIYEAILDADRESLEIYSGHGCAIAQAYNHMIMPLANKRDKQTQVMWGIEDFRYRFGRDPEGMWLAETAVDYETLEILVDHGIKFTILAPHQAQSVKLVKQDNWLDVSESRIDPRRPYLCFLPSGKSIAVFFYDGLIAQDLAFGGILNNGETMANRFLSAFGDGDDAQLVHAAVDGETFGHHHDRGEMALSYCLDYIESHQLARLTNYGEYLEKNPPKWEARLFENSSMHCVHGIERWRSDCGCNSGKRKDWNQRWRRPLREAVDWLRDQLIDYYEAKAPSLLADPWGARDRFIQVIQDRTQENIGDFLERETVGKLTDSERRHALHLLEMQRHAMLMYTSCGWFFDEISGIETTQVLRYAARAIQILEESGGPLIEEAFMDRLENAPSNLPEHRDGRDVYVKFVKPAMVDLMRVAIHFAVSSLFEEYEESSTIYCYDIESVHAERLTAGRIRLALGRALIRSRLTFEEQEFSFAVLHLGGQNLSGGIRKFMGRSDYENMCKKIRLAFRRNDVPEMIRYIDQNFDMHDFSLWHLFMDQKREIMSMIFAESEVEIERFHRNVYREHYPVMTAMEAMGIPLPKMLRTTLEVVLNRDLRQCLSALPVNEERFATTVGQLRKWSVEIDKEILGYEGSKQLAQLADSLHENPIDFEVAEEMKNLLRKYAELGVSLNLWYSQNRVYEIGLQQFHIRQYLAQEGDSASRRWVAEFKMLSDILGVDVE